MSRKPQEITDDGFNLETYRWRDVRLRELGVSLNLGEMISGLTAFRDFNLVEDAVVAELVNGQRVNEIEMKPVEFVVRPENTRGRIDGVAFVLPFIFPTRTRHLLRDKKTSIPYGLSLILTADITSTAGGKFPYVSLPVSYYLGDTSRDGGENLVRVFGDLQTVEQARVETAKSTDASAKRARNVAAYGLRNYVSAGLPGRGKRGK